MLGEHGSPHRRLRDRTRRPRRRRLPAGSAFRRIYARVSTPATARLRMQVYKRDAAGTETLVRDEYSDEFSNTTVAAQEWTATAAAAGALLATDRLVAKLYAQRVSGPTNITVTTFYEGTSHTSHIQTTISAGAQGPPGPAGPGVPAGGTAGQVLTKDTGTDYDTSWTDPASGGGGGDMNWAGAWNAGTTYAENDVVTYANGLWIAPAAITAGTVPGTEPAPPAEMLTNEHMATPDPHDWIGTAFRSYSSPNNTGPNNYHWFYFDVTTAGTITIDREPAVGTATIYVYRPNGTYLGTSSGADFTGTVTPTGRWKFGITTGSSGLASGTVRLVPGTAVLAAAPSVGAAWVRLAPSTIDQTYTPTAGYTADRVFNPETAAVQEVARVLGTLIDDMKTAGLLRL